MRTHSNENDFDLHENGRAGETHFHMNGFARRLVLKQRQRVTRKWPIGFCILYTDSRSTKHSEFLSYGIRMFFKIYGDLVEGSVGYKHLFRTKKNKLPSK